MASRKLTARFLTHGDMERWQRTMPRCSWRNVCALPFWMEIWPKAWGELRAVGLFSGEELVGGLLLAERRRWGQTVFETHPMVPYAGLWLAESEDASASRRESLYAAALETLDIFFKEHCQKAVLRLDPQFTDVRALIRRGWEVWIQYTYLTDLQVISNPEAAFENDARRQIALARERQITVVASSDWSVFAALAFQLQERKNLQENYPQGFLESLGAALVEEQCGTLYLVQSPDGKTLAAAAVAWAGDRAIYLYGGSALNSAGTGAPSLLQLEIIRSLMAKKMKIYDWHGANALSVARFKKNFNPQAAPYLVARRNYGLIGGIGHALRDAIRRWRMR